MQDLYFNVYSLPVILAGVINVILGIASWDLRGTKGQTAFALLMFACALYAFSYALELSSENIELIRWFVRFEYVGSVAIAPLLFLFSLKYTGRKGVLNGTLFLLFFLIPLVNLLVVFSNDFHHLFYQSQIMANNGLFWVMQFETGPWYWVHQGYTILAVLVSNIIIGKLFIEIDDTYKKKVSIILIGFIVTWLTYAAYLFGWIPWGLDPVPFAFALSGIIIYVGLINWQLFDITPVAQKVLFENLSEGVLFIDHQHRILKINKTGLDYLGVSKSILGKPIEDGLKDWPELSSIPESVVEKQVIEIHRSDRNLWLEVEFRQFFKDGIWLGYVILIKDVSIYKLVNESLKRKEGILSAVANCTYRLMDSNDFVQSSKEVFDMIGIATGVDRVYFFVNEMDESGNPVTSSQVSEWNSGEFTSYEGSPLLKSIPCSEFDYLFQHLTQKSPYESLVKNVKDDTLREFLQMQDILSILIIPVIVREKFWGFIGFDECKFERQWTEDERSILLAFAGTVGASIERNLLLQELSDALEKAMSASKAKSEFLANMSHEIRTPLNGVLGFTELLIKTPLNQIQSDYLYTVQSSAQTLMQLINDILDFSKIEAGKLEWSLVPVKLYSFINGVIDLIKYHAHKKGLELVINVSAEVPDEIYIDELRIKQVLINLLSNAVKFTEQGEIELKVAAELIKENEKNWKLSFAVRDTGIGILEENQQSIFEVFTQADNSTTRRFGGTGLGLTMSQKILKVFNSSIQLTSTPGVGSEFTFDIDVKGSTLIKGVQIPDSFKRVLIVDENEKSGQAIGSFLLDKDCSIVRVSNAWEALKSLDEGHRFDVAFISYNLPQFNGLKLAERIRRDYDDQSERTVLILMHTSNELIEIHQADGLWCLDHLWSKPVWQYSFEALISLISDQIPGESEANGKPDEESISVLSADSLRIMIVDDDNTNRQLAHILMREIFPQAKITTVNSGIQAIKLYNEELPHLILMDILMPEMDGKNVARMIRSIETELDHRSVIIALSAALSAEDIEEIFLSGMDDYLLKPVSEKKLKEKINEWLSLSS